jgi:uncharacterized protein (DUF2249 family)
MRLAISRRAAPQVPLLELCDLAKNRGLDGVEAVASDLDDVMSGEALRGRIAGIHVGPGDVAAHADVARRAAALAAPVIADGSQIDARTLADLGRLYTREGAELLLTHGTSLDQVAHVVESIVEAGSPALGSAWEIRTRTDDLSLAPSILLATTGQLKYIRLYGGGPELADEGTVGTGDLVTSIALSGYAGTIAQTPSSESRIGDWERWLEGKARHGCGTAYEKSESRRTTELDIRPVEAKDRLTTILGAYHSLTAGRTLHVTFDHDPSCMYYMLQATEPEGSFTFRKGEDGPTVWTANVTRVG